MARNRSNPFPGSGNKLPPETQRTTALLAELYPEEKRYQPTDEPAPKHVARYTRYEQAMRDKGYRKVHVWVREDQADEIKRIAAEMRQEEPSD